MTTAAPTFSQIKAQVAAIHSKVPQARVIGIQSSGRWTGESPLPDGEKTYAIRQCDSPLEMRLALREPTDHDTTKVLITNLEPHDLSNDILVRLAKRRLFQIDPWQIVRSLFDAHAVDPRLTRHAWIAESLLELIPPGGYPAVRSGFLDAETIWPLLLKQAIGLAADTLDLTSLLKWSLDAETTNQFRRSPEAFREAAVAWLSESLGPVAEIVLRCVEQLDRPDAVPIGLAATVLFHPTATGKLEKATGKLEERFLQGKTPDAGLMQRWSTAATEVVRALRHTESKAYRQTLQRADEILCEVQADAFAHLSDTSPLGFDQRLARLGDRLSEVLAGTNWNQLGELQVAHQAVRTHDQAAQDARRLEQVSMALRLVRWVGGRHRETPVGPQSFAAAAVDHVRDGGFVDWARLRLRAGDPVRELSQAYSRLFEHVTQIREQQSHQFSRLLADWTAAGSQGDEVLTVERILEQVVASLATESLVLVIVIDGMSVAVCRELLADVTRHEWMALSEPGRTFNRPGVAAIPSKTEFSRTSLLCGVRRQGTATDEKPGFAEHTALLSRCRSGYPPVLFHKATLQGADDVVLAVDVRKEIASTHRRIVGVVVNAVDDHLAKGEQINTRWSRDEIKVLPALLHEARIARRLVVLVSDHGHILDWQTQTKPCLDEDESGERWRAPIGEPAAEELLVEGSRVMTKGHRLIAPWSERVRYGIKKNGYHGGLTPQEMIVPIVVLSSTDDFPSGWQEQPVDTPTWWDEDAPTVADLDKSLPKLKPAKPQLPGTLFDHLEDHEEVTAPVIVTASTPEWIARLLSSPVFAEQKRLGGRGLPAEKVFAQLLETINQSGGKLTSTALARALEFPALRLPGLLAKVQRVLNIDGYAVLSRDDASDTIELNRGLLLKQFDLV